MFIDKVAAFLSLHHDHSSYAGMAVKLHFIYFCKQKIQKYNLILVLMHNERWQHVMDMSRSKIRQCLCILIFIKELNF